MAIVRECKYCKQTEMFINFQAHAKSADRTIVNRSKRLL